jgi:Tfp pilus assembly protein PilZ
MHRELTDKRSEFRFPVIVPVEYFKRDDTSIASYTLNLCKNGTFISTDDSLGVGNELTLKLSIPFDGTSSKIVQTKGTVVWDKIHPFKSKQNGMGVKFVESLPEDVLLNALIDSTRKLVWESKAKKALEERAERLEIELEQLKRLATLGRYIDKIFHELSNPIMALSGRLEIIQAEITKYKKILQEHDTANIKECGTIIKDLESNYKNIATTLKEYDILSELMQIVSDKGEALEERLAKRYKDE